MFKVGVGLRQGCVMSPWLFNIFMDRVVKDMNRLEKGPKFWQNGNNSEIYVLLFADDTVLVADSKGKLLDLVSESSKRTKN